MTQSDVARAAGLTRPAVSMALKNHPSIPEKTRRRILRIAEKLGYRPDPMLAALAAYRLRVRPASFQGGLAWLANARDNSEWKRIPTFKDYFAGATVQATRHGYQLEVFNLEKAGMTKERIAGVLHARNIAGVLLCPQLRNVEEMNFPWDKFSAITFGYSLLRPELHTVTATQFRAMVKTMRQLRARGYRRIGFAVCLNHDRRTNHNYLAAYLAEQHLSGQSSTNAFLDCEEYTPEGLQTWLRNYRPDAIVCGYVGILDYLGKLNVRVPDDLGVACPLLSTNGGELAGIFESSVQVGRVAVDLLIGMIQRGERGVPDTAQRVHVEGTWVEGKSLRPIVDRSFLEPELRGKNPSLRLR